MASSSNAINATLYDNLKFNFIRDTTPVASIARTPLVLVVNPSFPVKSVPELITYGKASPGKINMATAGIGSSLHLAGELFMTMTEVKLVPVHYRGLYVPDLLAGQVQLAFSPIPTTIEQVRAGKLRALAVTTPTRSPALPNIPTIGEFVAGYEASVWNGVVAPKGTPAVIVDKLHEAIDAALADPKLTTQFAGFGSVPKSMTPADFGKLSRIAWAQAYPTRPVRCIVGYAPGGGTDIFVRLVGQSLSARLGQPFVIENRAGASTNIATASHTCAGRRLHASRDRCSRCHQCDAVRQANFQLHPR
jgi:tripartite-type tricarboxylate transporter receptor subunit TctC